MSYYNMFILFAKNAAPVVEETPASFNILASSYSGAYAQDSLSPDFYNGAGSIVAGQLRPTNSDDFVLKGKKKSRDQEVTVNNGIGVIYLRIADDGRAWFVSFASTTNNLKVGVTNDALSTYFSTDRASLFDNNVDLSGVSLITAGIKGFEIYVKLDGIEIIRYKTRYHFKRPGVIGIKYHSVNGMTSSTIDNYARTFLYSDTDAGIIDAKDFDMKECATKGTVALGSYQITLDSVAGWNVNDTGIMEADFTTLFNGRLQGNRGTRGPGDVHPLKSYTNVDAMQEDRTQINNLRAWVEDTGATYKNSTDENTWKKISNPVLVGDQYIPEFYYDGEAVAKALRFKVLEINGNVLTIDKPSATNTTNSNVYFDNSYLLSRLIGGYIEFFLNDYPEEIGIDMTIVKENDIQVRMPAGRYALGEQLYFFGQDIRWYGMGEDETILFAPKGAHGFNVLAVQNHNTLSEDFSCEGNFGLQAYGGFWETWYPGFKASTGLQTEGIGFPYGWLHMGTYNSIMRNMKAKNIPWTFGGANSSSANLLRYKLHIRIDDPFMMYLQWLFQDADSTNTKFHGCTTDSDYITKSFEFFKCNGGEFIDCHARNGLWSLNSSTGWLMGECSQTLETNTRPAFMHQLTDMVSIAVNAGPTVSGGLVRNHNMLQTGYVDAQNNVLCGISLGEQNPGVVISGGSYIAPDYYPGAELGPSGIISTAPDLIVDGFTVVGNQISDKSFYKSSIAMTGGELKNSVAPDIYVGSTVVLGTGSEANVGTITTI